MSDPRETLKLDAERFWRAIRGLTAINATEFLRVIGIEPPGGSPLGAAESAADRTGSPASDGPDRRTDSTSADRAAGLGESENSPESTGSPGNTSRILRPPGTGFSDESPAKASQRCPACGAALDPSSDGAGASAPPPDRPGSSGASASDPSVASASVEAWDKTSELTEAMILAGRKEIWGYDPEYDSDREIVSRIFSAMMEAKSYRGIR